MDTEISTSTVTPVFRASYLNVFKPAFNKLNKKNEYSVEALFEPGEKLEHMKKMAEAACLKKWGTDRTKWPNKLRSPFRDQGEKMKDGKLPEGCAAGALFIRFKCDEGKRPGVVDQNKTEILDPSKFQSGDYARAHVNAFAYDAGGNTGVSFGLNHIQLYKTGTPFSGRPKVEDAFAAVEGAGQAATDASSLF